MQAEFRASNARALRMGLWGTEPAYYFREPEDVALIGKATHRFGKIIKGFERFKRFCGSNSILILRDDNHHAALRSILQPFFTLASLKNLTPVFLEAADEMVDVMLLTAAAPSASPVDLETVTRRAMLDVIGRTAFGYDFEALRLWKDKLIDEKSMQEGSEAFEDPSRRRERGRARTSAYNYARAADVGQPPLDIIDIVGGTYFMAMIQTFDPPIPDFMLPGFSKYIRGIEQLEACVLQVLEAYKGEPVAASEPTKEAVCYEVDGGSSANSRPAEVKKKKKKAPSLLGCLVAARDAGELDGTVDDGVIRDNLLTFMIAGSDTVATTFALALFELAHHPEVQARVVTELKNAGLLDQERTFDEAPPPPELILNGLPFMSAVIKETLRMYPPAPSTGRLAENDEVLGGYFVPAGSQVVIDFFNMHRHEKYWHRADEWLPERWMPEGVEQMGPTPQDAYEPFGIGARGCIGKVFANLELHYMLAHVMRRLALEPVPGSGPEVHLHKSFTLRSEDSLFVAPRERLRDVADAS